jgi:hypothetical protein
MLCKMNLSISSRSQLFPEGGIKALGRVNADKLADLGLTPIDFFGRDRASEQFID